MSADPTRSGLSLLGVSRWLAVWRLPDAVRRASILKALLQRGGHRCPRAEPACLMPKTVLACDSGARLRAG